MKTIFTLLILFISTTCLAAEKHAACVKYKKSNGWSRNYSVIATILSGSELNAATSSLKYSGFNYYTTVFWSDGEVTILKLPPLTMGSLPIFPTDVSDQYNRKWKINAGSICM